MSRISRAVFAALTAAFLASNALCAGKVEWVCSTAGKSWQSMPAPVIGPANPETPADVRVATDKTRQVIDGFGGCFNELGWVALGKATEVDRKDVLRALFGDDGCAFTLARLPIGSSDFATDAYSLDDTPDDYDLKHFSIDRDKRQLIPFVKAAMAVRPNLRCWGSPWSPPAWMKTNNSYRKGSLKSDPAILQAYAKYFLRWLSAYRAEGISIYALSPQNEPNIESPYPSCLWTASQLREFIGDFLGPALRNAEANVELWLVLNGDPFNRGENVNDRLVGIMEDPIAGAFINGLGFQYDSRDQLAIAHELYPDRKLIRTETECRRGQNSWADAQALSALMKHSFESGANAYFLWNLVLDETGMGPWKWRQNAPITVDRKTGRITYNGEYYAMRHFSQFVKPGAKRVMATGIWGDKIAFVNPDGSTVLVMDNSDRQPHDVLLEVGGRADGGTFQATLPPESINTFVLAR